MRSSVASSPSAQPLTSAGVSDDCPFPRRAVSRAPSCSPLRARGNSDAMSFRPLLFVVRSTLPAAVKVAVHGCGTVSREDRDDRRCRGGTKSVVANRRPRLSNSSRTAGAKLVSRASSTTRRKRIGGLHGDRGQPFAQLCPSSIPAFMSRARCGCWRGEHRPVCGWSPRGVGGPGGWDGPWRWPRSTAPLVPRAQLVGGRRLTGRCVRRRLKCGKSRRQ